MSSRRRRAGARTCQAVVRSGTIPGETEGRRLPNDANTGIRGNHRAVAAVIPGERCSGAETGAAGAKRPMSSFPPSRRAVAVPRRYEAARSVRERADFSTWIRLEGALEIRREAFIRLTRMSSLLTPLSPPDCCTDKGPLFISVEPEAVFATARHSAKAGIQRLS